MVQPTGSRWLIVQFTQPLNGAGHPGYAVHPSSIDTVTIQGYMLRAPSVVGLESGFTQFLDRLSRTSQLGGGCRVFAFVLAFY